MYYSRHILALFNAIFIIGAASAAVAQSAPSSVPPGAYKEWPGTPQEAMRPNANYNDGIESEGSGAIPALPLEVQTAGGITYITGGVGDEEVAQLKATEKEYNLHILMSAPGGAFISDVSLHIADASGKEVLASDGVGPYFYAKLPVGAYTIVLTSEGESKKLPVKIKDNSNVRQTVQFKVSPGFVTPHQPTATVE
jgi:hypothetical protein